MALLQMYGLPFYLQGKEKNCYREYRVLRIFTTLDFGRIVEFAFVSYFYSREGYYTGSAYNGR